MYTVRVDTVSSDHVSFINQNHHLFHFFSMSRHHLGILLAVFFLYLLTWGAGLLTIYGYVFPDPARIILEMVFAIAYTVLGGFIFIVLCLNKKVLPSTM